MRMPEFRVKEAQCWDVFSDNGYDFILIDDFNSKVNPNYYQSIVLDINGKPIIKNWRAQLQVICIEAH